MNPLPSALSFGLLMALAFGAAEEVAVSESDLASADTLDVVLTGGQVIDGTGNPWFKADVGIAGGRVAAVGDLSGREAHRRVDVAGQVVIPGFVDMHSHASDVAWEGQGFDSEDARRRAAPNLVAQGVTTVSVNHDGRSPVDIGAQRRRYEEHGIGVNAVLMVGHGAVRRAVMKDDYRRHASDEEVRGMRLLVRQAMMDGAGGLTAGLEYTPGRWSQTDEVVELVEEVRDFDGVYISHQRSEGADPMWFWPSVDSAGPPTLIDAILETIEIGERTGARVVASHVKAKGAHYWGTSATAVQLIQAARDRGVRVWADQYPYTTSGSDGSTVLIPSWAFGRRDRERDERPDYTARFRETLEDPIKSGQVRQDIEHEIRRRGGAGRVVILEAPDSSFVGQSLLAASQRIDRSPVETAIWLQLTGDVHRRGGVRLRGFSMDEIDVDRYAAKPWVATASDAGIALPGDGPVHPRYWGTFPRKIRRYAMERGVLTVAEAVRSATSLPARLLGLNDRGLVQEGMVADLAVIDLEKLTDRATTFNPHAEPEGVVHVFLGGEQIVESGRRTGALVGQVLVPGR